MVYIFGDIRQLRKFELSRPPISRPQTISNPHHSPVISTHFPFAPSRPISNPPILPVSQPVRPNSLPQPPSLNIPSILPLPAATPGSPRIRSVSSSTAGSFASTASNEAGSAYISSPSVSEGHGDAAHTIEISPAFYDDSNVEGPATGSPTSVPYINLLSMHSVGSKNHLEDAEFTPTASFIPPYDPQCDDDFDGSRKLGPEEKQGIEPFDFDLLPKRGCTFLGRDRAVSIAANGAASRSMTEKDRDTIAGLRSLMTFLRQFQHKCSKEKPSTDPGTHIYPPSKSLHASSQSPHRLVDPTTQSKLIKAVPAFASPFTRVLNPTVTRAQWEIVVRSAAVAGIVCWTVVGCLVAVPARS
jgi:hypothetical protein